MLDKAEDPEKLIKLMIREMEDTLIELKASCAGVIAGRKKNQRRLDNLVSRQEQWQARANLAVSRGRDDLAREALNEKRRFSDMVSSLKQDLMDRITSYNVCYTKLLRQQGDVFLIFADHVIVLHQVLFQP